MGGSVCDQDGREGGLILRARGDPEGYQARLASSDLYFEMFPPAVGWVGVSKWEGGKGQNET